MKRIKCILLLAVLIAIVGKSNAAAVDFQHRIYLDLEDPGSVLDNSMLLYLFSSDDCSLQTLANQIAHRQCDFSLALGVCENLGSEFPYAAMKGNPSVDIYAIVAQDGYQVANASFVPVNKQSDDPDAIVSANVVGYETDPLTGEIVYISCDSTMKGSVSLSPYASIPEPTSFHLLLLACACLFLKRRSPYCNCGRNVI